MIAKKASELKNGDMIKPAFGTFVEVTEVTVSPKTTKIKYICWDGYDECDPWIFQNGEYVKVKHSTFEYSKSI